MARRSPSSDLRQPLTRTQMCMLRPSSGALLFIHQACRKQASPFRHAQLSGLSYLVKSPLSMLQVAGCSILAISKCPVSPLCLSGRQGWYCRSLWTCIIGRKQICRVAQPTAACCNPRQILFLFRGFDSDQEVADPFEDEHHVIFDCPEYTYVRKQFPDLFNSSLVLIGHFLNQPDCNRMTKILTQDKTMRMNLA